MNCDPTDLCVCTRPYVYSAQHPMFSSPFPSSLASSPTDAIRYYVSVPLSCCLGKYEHNLVVFVICGSVMLRIILSFVRASGYHANLESGDCG